jgi:hypothetical protein
VSLSAELKFEGEDVSLSSPVPVQLVAFQAQQRSAGEKKRNGIYERSSEDGIEGDETRRTEKVTGAGGTTSVLDGCT